MGFFYEKQMRPKSIEEERLVPNIGVPEIQTQDSEELNQEKQGSRVSLDNIIGSAEDRASVLQNLKEMPEKTMLPLSEIEETWAETKTTKELQTLENNDPETPVEASKKKRTSLGRTNQIKTRLTDSELKRFRKRVEKSGLQQGEFIRKAVLNNQILIEERSYSDIELLDEVALLRAELGRQGGLLKMVIKPNEGQRELNPKEWEELIETIRGMERVKRKLSALERKITNGDRKT